MVGLDRQRCRKRIGAGQASAIETAAAGAAASKVATRSLPDWLVRLGGWRDPRMKDIVPILGVNMNATSAKARRLLGWNPRPAEEAIVATAESVVRLKLLAPYPS